MTFRTGAALGCASVTLFVVLLCSVHAQQVSFHRLLRADREPQNWLSYSGTVFNQRHSLLTQITPANVKNLELK
jgi:alcohol dehydrogenase (cytochrome c)